jgi:hypothetical protein
MNVVYGIVLESTQNGRVTVAVYSDLEKAKCRALELDNECKMVETVYIEEWMLDSEVRRLVW